MGYFSGVSGEESDDDRICATTCSGFEQGRDGLAFVVLAIGCYSREWLGKVVKHPFMQRSDNGLVFASHGRTALVKGYGVSWEFIAPAALRKAVGPTV